MRVPQVGLLSATQSTISILTDATRSQGLMVTIPLVILASLVAAVLTIVSCQRERVRDTALLNANARDSEGKFEVFISYRVR